jgi:hypothetical protein
LAIFFACIIRNKNDDQEAGQHLVMEDFDFSNNEEQQKVDFFFFFIF